MTRRDESAELARELGDALLSRGWMLATAESCTGGGVAYAVTAVAGSSRWFDRSFVTYSNQAKQEMLGVLSTTLERYGAVSEAVVSEMAQGALSRSAAGMALAISGIAGPDGGSPAKPVGTVCFAWVSEAGQVQCATEYFAGDRAAVREQAVVHALQGALALLSSSSNHG